MCRSFCKQNKIERVYWIVVCIAIIIFGINMGLFWFSLFISVVVILGGALATKDNKNVGLMVATLLFAIVTFQKQNQNFSKQLDMQSQALKKQIDNFELSKKNSEIQYTPDLRALVECKEIYAGTREINKAGRMDDSIVIPIKIYNRAYGYAKDVTLAMCYNHGGEDKILKIDVPFMKGGESYQVSFAPSVDNGFRELFLNSTKTFKVKIILDWKDTSGKKYRSVENFTLTHEKQGLDASESFIFKSLGFFSSLDNDIQTINKQGDNR